MAWITVCRGDAQNMSQIPPRKKEDRPADPTKWIDGQLSALENTLAPEDTLCRGGQPLASDKRTKHKGVLFRLEALEKLSQQPEGPKLC